VVATAFEEPVALEGDEVMMDRTRRGEADRVGDLADGGWISALLHGLRNAVEDSLASLVVVPGHMPSGARCALCT
jgi:hypothetical protein